MIDSWTQALFVTPPKMCGRRLRPFSLSHSLALRMIGSPYAYKDVTATRGELLQAVLICSRTHAENVRLLADGPPFWGTMLFGLRWKGVDFSIADSNFRQYLREHTRAAPREQAPITPDEQLAAPSEYHLHRVLCDTYGYAPDSAWDVSFGLARALYDTNGEAHGVKGLLSEYEQTVAEYTRREADARDKGDLDGAEAIWRELAEYVARFRKV